MDKPITEATILKTDLRFVLIVASLFSGFIVWGITLSALAESNRKDIQDIETSIKTTQEIQTDNRIRLTEIQTQLRGIDATLIEIKQRQ